MKTLNTTSLHGGGALAAIAPADYPATVVRIQALHRATLPGDWDIEILRALTPDGSGSDSFRGPESVFSLNAHELARIRALDDDAVWPYLRFRFALKVLPDRRIVADAPPHLLLELVSFCNLRCGMCFQRDAAFSGSGAHGVMDIDLFKACVDGACATGCKALTMASRGEPLLHPRFPDMLAYCSGKFLDLKINTNATLLDERLALGILAGGVTSLVFSVDSHDPEQYARIRPGSNFSLVFDNIKRFQRLRQNFPGHPIRTRISGVRVDGQELHDLQRFWGEWVDEVALIPPAPRTNSYVLAPHGDQKPCRLLWERMYVWHDGSCNPCDFDYRSFLTVGNVRDGGIRHMWTSPDFARLRALHLCGERQKLTPCDRCPF